MEFTIRNAAKYAAKAIVHHKTAQFTETIITDNTRFEEDDMIVDISGHLVGWYISEKVKPVTDYAIDKTADFIIAKREARNAKKETTPSAE